MPGVRVALVPAHGPRRGHLAGVETLGDGTVGHERPYQRLLTFSQAHAHALLARPVIGAQPAAAAIASSSSNSSAAGG